MFGTNQGGSLFGGPAATTGATPFAQPPSTGTAPGAGGMFGKGPTPQTGGSLFGQAATGPNTSLFNNLGAQQAGQQNPTPFGGATTTTTPATGLFNNAGTPATTNPQPTGFPTATSTPNLPTLFGGVTQQPATTAPPGGLFGNKLSTEPPK